MRARRHNRGLTREGVSERRLSAEGERLAEICLTSSGISARSAIMSRQRRGRRVSVARRRNYATFASNLATSQKTANTVLIEL